MSPTVTVMIIKIQTCWLTWLCGLGSK